MLAGLTKNWTEGDPFRMSPQTVGMLGLAVQLREWQEHFWVFAPALAVPFFPLWECFYFHLPLLSLSSFTQPPSCFFLLDFCWCLLIWSDSSGCLGFSREPQERRTMDFNLMLMVPISFHCSNMQMSLVLMRTIYLLSLQQFCVKRAKWRQHLICRDAHRELRFIVPVIYSASARCACSRLNWLYHCCISEPPQQSKLENE